MSCVGVLLFVAYRELILRMVSRRLLMGLKPTELQCYNNYTPVEMLNRHII